MAGLPKKYAKMGFKKGWKAYKASKRSPSKSRTSSKRKTSKRKSSSRMSGQSQGNQLIPLYGGAKRKTSKRRSTSMRGEVTTFGREKGLKGIVALLSDAGIGVGGAIAANVVSNVLPAPSYVRALAPIGAGIIAANFKNPMIKMAGLGMAIGGGLNAVRRFVGPSIPVLAGDDIDPEMLDDVADALVTGEISPAELANYATEMESPELMGLVEEFAGEVAEFAGEDDYEDVDDVDAEGMLGISDFDMMGAGEYATGDTAMMGAMVDAAVDGPAW